QIAAWLLMRGRDPSEAFAAAADAYGTLAPLPQDARAYEPSVNYLAWRATWVIGQGGDPTVWIERLDAKIAAGLEGGGERHHLIAYRGVSHLLRATVASGDAEARARHLDAMRAAWDEAQTINRWSEYEIRAWLPQARRLTGDGPTVSIRT
ncbi:MAG: hypothetical protein AAF772_21635, partial [Acidobacteriota bacterium]